MSEVSAAPTQPTPQQQQTCSKCSKPDEKLLLCARCQTVRYCSKECQVSDWSTHKLKCVAPGTAVAATQPKTATADPAAAKKGAKGAIVEGSSRAEALKALKAAIGPVGGDSKGKSRGGMNLRNSDFSLKANPPRNISD